jgi:hypothetical protein
MLKNVAGKTARRLGAEAYGFWYVEANSRMRTPLGAGRVSARRGGRVRKATYFEQPARGGFCCGLAGRSF